MRRARPALGAAALLVTALTSPACRGGSEGSAAELCKAVQADRSTTAVLSGFDPSNTVQALAQLRAARVTLGQLRDAAPSEVRDDLDVEIAYVQALIDGLKGLDGEDAAASVEMVRRVTGAHPNVDAAAAELAAFSTAHCSTSST